MADFNVNYLTVYSSWSLVDSVLRDGNTKGWYEIGDGSATYMTKDGGENVSVWKDLSGNSNDLAEATNQPVYSATGITFDGVNDRLWKEDMLTGSSQPYTVYIVFKSISWTGSDRIFELSVGSGIYLEQSSDGSPYLTFMGGSALEYAELANGTFGIVRCVLNGATSKEQVNEASAITGAGGSRVGGSVTVGTGTGNIQVKAFIVRNVADSDENQMIIVDYLNNKYSIY